MAISESTSAADATMAESEGPDNSDKPPNVNYLSGRFNQSLNLAAANEKLAGAPTLTPSLVNGKTLTPENSSNFPLPPPDTLIKGEKQPGFTRQALEKLTAPSDSDRRSTKLPRQPSGSYSPKDAPSPSYSPTALSPTESYFGGDSAPPSRPPSKPASRAPSMSAGVSGNKILPGATAPTGRERRGSKPEAPTTPGRVSKPASIHSDKGDSHKFTLKDLLNSGPKLSRKSSQRSTSSRRSDSDAGEGRAKSTAGDSTASLSQKYGVCQKLAIGKGATSVVRLAHKWDRTEEKLYAIKEFRKRRKNESEKEYVKKLTAEFCISSTLHHPNIVETVDLVQDESMHWCEVMEFCPGGDLYAAIKRGGMSPAEVECCFKQMLKGVSYLHSQGVAHRDLKPENLFFDAKGHLKIGDYGASTVYRLPWEQTVHMSSGLCGSEPYIAPEQFLNKPYDARLVDIWACGIVYYCLHFQELPWRAAQPATDQLYAAYAQACSSSNAQTSACPPTINNLSPRACRPLIRKMLEPNPRERWAIEKVIAHPWIESVEVCHDVDRPKHFHSCAREMGAAYMNGN
ncbi:other/HAL protein kinase [Ephemerocybe angulata]|uniref:non-specific serine/threonine protein kinase n=1 Tax=Ephemerocybe angulata TaxID=980116 RepID=A0A8H6HRZ2_9AGAR|nr:other/HAL protein kinase [Tulosesus angulatus]